MAQECSASYLGGRSHRPAFWDLECDWIGAIDRAYFINAFHARDRLAGLQ